MRGDFTGFSFGKTHTEDLGIVRVSGGDRYEEQLHPEIKDITAEVPGMDGQYYFGSTYGTKTFDLELAFDSLTERQFRQLRQVFGTRKIEKLIFDEEPYKYYLAKLESPIELSYVCFDEEDYEWDKISRPVSEGGGYYPGISKDEAGNAIPFEYKKPTGNKRRVYKGEGKITFVCNYPFAKSEYKQLPKVYIKTKDTEIVQGKSYYQKSGTEYELVDNPIEAQLGQYYELVDDGGDSWAVSSGILSAESYQQQQLDQCRNGVIPIYNPGDLPTGFRLYVPAAALANDLTIKLAYIAESPEKNIAQLQLSAITQLKDASEQGVLIDTNNQLIVGVTSIGDVIETSGNLYNEYIKAGYLFKIPSMDALENADGSTNDPSYAIKINSNNQDIEIFYDYLYF